MVNKHNSRPMMAKLVNKHKRASKSKVLKVVGVWQEQWRYAVQGSLSEMWRQPLATMLTVTVIAISLTMPSVCYMIWKNISQAADQWYPAPHLTVYLSKTLNDDAAENVVAQLSKENGVDKINYLSREETLDEFRNWSGFGGIMGGDLLEQNPLPAVAVITPKIKFQHSDTMNHLRDRISKVQGIDEVKMDDSWFNHLAALTCLIAKVVAMIVILMIAAMFLVISNSVRLSIFARRDTINIQKLIGATDGFILRPFLYGGAILGFVGALLSLVLSEILVMYLDSVVTQIATVFRTSFILQGLGYDESMLLLLIAAMIGWLAAWLATVQHLRRFTPR